MMAELGLFLRERRVNMNNKSISSKSETDYSRLDAMTDADIDLSDCPEVTASMFAGAVVRKALNTRFSKGDALRTKVTIAIDRDVLEWFQAQGDKADLQMALALKIYMEANKAYSLDR
jgi:uncharacterized protein (DUF4415 family)